MPNQIIPVVWEKPLRKSAVNTLDKLNEVIDFINASDIHEFSFIDGDTGREVVSGTSTQLATLDVFGECVQDGTPTPDNPVEVQVVEGANLVNAAYGNMVPSISTGELVQANGWTCDLMPILQSADYYFRAFNPTGQVYVFFYGETQNFLGYVIGDSVSNGVFLSQTNYTATAKYFRIRADNAWNSDPQFIGIRGNTAISNFIPGGSIALMKNNTPYPIDLQGHVLASLPDGTQDLLRVDSAGVKGIEQYVGVVDLGSLNWAANATNTSGVYRMLSTGLQGTVKPSASTSVIANAICAVYPQISTSGTYNTTFGVAVGVGGQIYIYDPSYNASDSVEAFKAAMDGVLLYYELAESQHVDLGVMDMPPIPSGSVIKIVASLQPEFDIQWWTESAIPSVINGLKAYVDEQIETVNARIDELHGITRATIVRPDVSIPAIELEPIEKITVDETETDTEKEI